LRTATLRLQVNVSKSVSVEAAGCEQLAQSRRTQLTAFERSPSRFESSTRCALAVDRTCDLLITSPTPYTIAPRRHPHSVNLTLLYLYSYATASPPPPPPECSTPGSAPVIWPARRLSVRPSAPSSLSLSLVSSLFSRLRRPSPRGKLCDVISGRGWRLLMTFVRRQTASTTAECRPAHRSPLYSTPSF